MEQLEAVMLNSPGEAARAALRKGPVLVVAVRLGVGAWEPLYGLIGSRPMELPLEFQWSLEALATLEAAAVMR
jgi:hypothetical protein